MALEHLLGQDLGEQVGRIHFTWQVANMHLTSTTQLAHLEQLAVDVARVLSSCEAMAQVTT